MQRSGLIRLPINIMRDRSQQTTQHITNTIVTQDLLTGTSTTGGTWAQDVVVHESLMRDDPTGGQLQTKPITHMVYDVLSMNESRDAYHSADASNAPNPRLRFNNLQAAPGRTGTYRPPALTSWPSYIPVTNVTSNDLDDCAFKAYNQFVNGIRSLDASVSIAELRETPQLFQIWQRRRGLASNLTNGFLNYSFGWRPLLQDLAAISRELRSFPATVRRRLKAIGKGEVVRHYKFDLSSTVDDVNFSAQAQDAPYEWGKYGVLEKSVNKRRTVVVTIRARVKPKLTGEGQELLNKLGALGLIPSLATLWSITRLSFVVDWFYNIGGAIENLQGSLTHDVSNVKICVTDKRTRVIELFCTSVDGQFAHLYNRIEQKCFTRFSRTRPILPPLRLPTRAMNYVLLGLIGLSSTNVGNRILTTLDGFRLPNRLNDNVTRQVNRWLTTLSPHSRRLFRELTGI